MSPTMTMTRRTSQAINIYLSELARESDEVEVDETLYCVAASLLQCEAPPEARALMLSDSGNLTFREKNHSQIIVTVKNQSLTLFKL